MERTVNKPAAHPDAMACANCVFVHHDGKTNEFACWKNPPLPIGAFIQTQNGTQLVQASARAPVAAEDWCGEFKRKLAS